MKKFPFNATVSRRIVDNIELIVLAETEEEAREKVYEVLQNFPDETYQPEVTRCAVSVREASEVEISDVEQKGPVTLVRY